MALTANAKVRDIAMSGNIVKTLGGAITLDKELTGTMQNLNVDVAISEDLGYFHKANPEWHSGFPLSTVTKSAMAR